MRNWELDDLSLNPRTEDKQQHNSQASSRQRKWVRFVESERSENTVSRGGGDGGKHKGNLTSGHRRACKQCSRKKKIKCLHTK